MDPVMHAAQSFLAQADAFWRKHPGRLQPLAGLVADRGEMVKALRLGELAPDNRRPLFLYEAPFEETDRYLRGLREAIERDYEAVREGIAGEGVEIPAFIMSPLDVGPVGCAALAMEGAAALLGERFDGVTVALLPEQVTDGPAWKEVVGELDRLPWSPRVRIAVHAVPQGLLDGVLQPGGAQLFVDLPALLAFLRDLGAGSAEPGQAAITPAPEETARQLRTLLLDAAAHTAAGEHTAAAGRYEEAAALCVSERLSDEEAIVRMALGGAYMAAEIPALAVESYCKAAGLAAALGAWSLSCVAWLGAGGTYLALGNDEPAAAAYQAAVAAARKGELPVLRDEALRMQGECMRHLGRTEEPHLGASLGSSV
jgi:tetratricopeptide (TPR) repeat protein